jgi:formiminoglutamate deiminase
MTSFWCEHAIIGGRIGGMPASGLRIEEIDGVITSVATTAPVPGDVILSGLVLPGFANGHSHAFHRVLRGRTHDDGGTFWTWREQMYRVAARLDPDNYFELATAVFAEMVLAGYTVVGEFHYVHHQPDGTAYTGPAMEEAIVAAAERAGIRLTLLDTFYPGDGVGSTGLEPGQRRFADPSVEAWAARRDSVTVNALARMGAAIHSVRAVSPSHYEAIAAASVGMPLHAHVSEQLAENATAVVEYGKTPVELLEPVLGQNFTAVHGTHLSAHDIELLHESTVCFCPTTERDLADGIGPASALRDSAVKLSLGSDQNAIIDPFEEMRGLEMDDRLASGERGRFSPIELLTAGTVNGYASLGWNGGVIEVGRVCDLVAVSTTSTRTAGASLNQLWLAATAADVTDVIVGGIPRVTAGQHSLGDVGALLAEAIGRLGS